MGGGFCILVTSPSPGNRPNGRFRGSSFYVETNLIIQNTEIELDLHQNRLATPTAAKESQESIAALIVLPVHVQLVVGYASPKSTVVLKTKLKFLKVFYQTIHFIVNTYQKY